MIRFFKASRMTAVLGSLAGAAAGAGAAWLLYPGDGATRAVLMLVAAALALNVFLYIAKIVAVRRYQEILLLLYEKLDPEAFLAQALPILDRKAKTADRVTHAAHVANGYLAQGEADLAIALLKRQQVPDQAAALRGLIASNLGTACLQKGDRAGASAALKELKQVVASPNCKEKFREKARRIIAYQQICLDILNGKTGGIKALEQDYETAKSPFHKMNAGMFLAGAYERMGEREKGEQMRRSVGKLRETAAAN